MAKICSQCGCENANDNVFCMECGASLAYAAEVADNKKGKRIKQEQNPVARRMLAIVLIAAALLCLFTTFQYVLGVQPVQTVIKEDKEYMNSMENRVESDDIMQILRRFANSPNNSITMENNWKNLALLVDHAVNSTSLNQKYAIYTGLTFVSQLCYTLAYLILSVFAVLSVILVLKKSPRGKTVTLITGIAGLCIMVIGFLVCYFLITERYSYYIPYVYTNHILPQKTIWALLPLFALMPMLGVLLPAKDKLPEVTDANEEGEIFNG